MSSTDTSMIASSATSVACARFWRSIAEAEGRPESAVGSVTVDGVTRRDFMKVMSAGLVLAGAATTGGCAREPLEKIVPYREGPAEATYGKPVFYATALPCDGYGAGVLVECNMGRPTKIEGNPTHPASLGATDVFAQAAVLDLWDPERSQTVIGPNGIATWDAFLSALQERLRGFASTSGSGLRVLTENVTSPTLAAQLAVLLERFPEARWHRYQPLDRTAVHAGARLAFGEILEPIYRFDLARIVMAFDADFLTGMPGSVRYAHDFATTRNGFASASVRSRLYVCESTPGVSGAAAEHRLPLKASDMGLAVQALAHALGVAATAPAMNVLPEPWLGSLVNDLTAHRGASIVIVGDRQPPAVHAMAHTINAHLGNLQNTVFLLQPVAARVDVRDDSMIELASAMQAGTVDTLVVLDANPVYTAPVDIAFTVALNRVPFTVHWGAYRDETAMHCSWHVPATHPLETWSDIRAFDGTVTIQQPCIAPLYNGRSVHEMVAALANDPLRDPHAIVRRYWQEHATGDFEVFWERALREGVVAETTFSPAHPSLRSNIALSQSPPAAATGIEITFYPDPRIGDGRYANNAWLQELPKPVTQLTWDNAALLSPVLAQRLNLRDEDEVELRIDDRTLTAPVWITPGQPDDSVAVALGYGRRSVGTVGRNHGFDAYALRVAATPWFATGLALTRTGRRGTLATTQMHARMEGRDLVRSITVAQASACAPPACSTAERKPAPTLYDSPPQGPYAWAMSIDLGSCIGCGACTIACQAENNIPVVGKDEVRRGREMHWIRVDRYFEGGINNPRTIFQPVPCMQCEHAPCELVCPVEASVHDSQGINVQVYNRCVGTRFCSNNCPYKVRRFNFLSYTRDEPALNAQRNPEVTVRMRGVMEKCNYCLQRITTARIEADKETRSLRDGEVVTACQAVCPTQAIVFGNLNDPDSAVNRCKRSPLDYALLAELNTRPRTTYIARITDPVEALRAP